MIETLDSRMLVNPFAGKGEDKTDCAPSTPKSQIIEGVRQITDPLVLLALENYAAAEFRSFSDWSIAYKNIKDLPVLTPEQITILTTEIIARFPIERVISQYTGRHISLLMMESHRAGYNDFMIDNGDVMIEELPAHMLRYPSKERIRYTDNGASYAPWILQSCDAVFRGEISKASAFMHCEDSHIVMYHDLKEEAGMCSKSCRFDFHGSVGCLLGYNMNDCVVTLHSGVGDRAGRKARDCTFRSTVEDTYRKLKDAVDKDSGNTVQLIDAKENIIEEVKL